MRKILMQGSMGALLGLTLLLFCTVESAYGARAQTEMAYHAQTRYATEHTSRLATMMEDGQVNGHVTSLVLDMSGSMSGNDPYKVRCAAADTYISLSRPGEYIGLVGLVNRDNHANADGRFQSAEVWSPPVQMTYSGRQQLQQIIADKCNPGGNTPTYDALAQAYQQLADAIGTHTMSGSVVVLTDGAPEPNPNNQQIQAIETELVPRFRAKGWHIDTVAIGTTETNFGFLKTVSTETGGQDYDESQGKVATALNMMPLFVDIFRREVGRTPGPGVPQTALSNGTSTQEFTVNPYADHLDIIVVYDTPGTSVTLKDPQGNIVHALPVVNSGNAPQYDTVYSIDKPVAAYNNSTLIPWTLTVAGSGNFLMNSLLVSRLKVIIHTPTETFLPLGKELTVSATVNNLDGSLYNGSFAVTGTLHYVGGGNASYSQPLTLNLTRPSYYQTNVTVPATAPSGAYQIDVSATQTSGDNKIASATLPLRLDIFPYPYLCTNDCSTTATSTTTQATALRWPDWLQFYSLPIFQWLSVLPLQGHSIQPAIDLDGQFKIQGGTLYTKKTIVTALVVYPGAKNPVAAQARYQGGGRFHLSFPVAAGGDYQVAFQTQGDAADSHGDMLTTTRTIHVGIQDATLEQRMYAGGVTAAYVLFLLFFIFYLRYCLTCPPFGSWELIEGGQSGRPRKFKSAWYRRPIQTFFARNILASQQTGLPPGLTFRFKHRNTIEVRAAKGKQQRWLSAPTRFKSVRELHFAAAENEKQIYNIKTDRDKRSRNNGYFLGVVYGVLGLLILGAGLLFRGTPIGLIELIVGPLLALLGLAQALPNRLSRSSQKKPKQKRLAQAKKRTQARSKTRR